MSPGLLPQEKETLDNLGYLILPNFFPNLLEPLRTRINEIFAAEGDRAGAEFKQEPGCRRLANLVDKGDIFQQVISHPRMLPYIRHVLGDAYKLSSLNVRSVDPHWTKPQPLHADMAAISDDHGYWVCNAVWMLDDITSQNGPLRAIPGTHQLRKLPSDILTDLKKPHPDEVLITGRAGTVVIMNAHLWHSGLGNYTAHPRTALHAFYCRRDKPQQQYQKQLLHPELQKALSPDLRYLLALDDPLNDELSSRPRVTSGFLKG
ncbi:MAG TPA: phytanoyl-CoA dioxygenase family protein [Pirellulaceae bacterium]|jgi:ectoine hydroxylase-related dioxygenase (phytanoyl-CoA dioxygenase family)